MNGEEIFKDIVSGNNDTILGDVARKGLGWLSKAYEKGVTLRNDKFDAGKGVTRVNVPVISVGNITAGGTGKTPMVRFICDALIKQGKHPAVLSRGYRAEDNKKNIVISNNGKMLVEPSISGDEAWLLGKVLPHTGVVIGRERVALAHIAINELGADILVMDDGFQHRALGRDKDIVLLDASNPFGYDYVLPRGLLREPLEGLKRASIIVLTKVDQVTSGVIASIKKRLQQLVPGVPVFETTHMPQRVCTLEEWTNGEEGRPVDAYINQPIMACSGIGNPKSFELTLKGIGYDVVHMLSFGDHHEFSNDDVVDMWKMAFAKQAQAVIITEKDAVKLSQLRAIDDFNLPIYVLCIGIEFISNERDFIELLHN